MIDTIDNKRMSLESVLEILRVDWNVEVESLSSPWEALLMHYILFREAFGYFAESIQKVSKSSTEADIVGEVPSGNSRRVCDKLTELWREQDGKNRLDNNKEKKIMREAKS